MNIPLPTLEDLPSNKRNCGTCTRQGGSCARSKSKNSSNGYIKSSVTNEISGMICCCPHYTGRY